MDYYFGQVPNRTATSSKLHRKNQSTGFLISALFLLSVKTVNFFWTAPRLHIQQNAACADVRVSFEFAEKCNTTALFDIPFLQHFYQDFFPWQEGVQDPFVVTTPAALRTGLTQVRMPVPVVTVATL
jgi:hypothetical protein